MAEPQNIKDLKKYYAKIAKLPDNQYSKKRKEEIKKALEAYMQRIKEVPLH